ncbi:MAG: phospho-N-acetylmuramoyl-pentapeptide-transferase [Deinococcales bacterium]|nr:phospho-N-acetylmuramoyl-pentapeptide-transferase [Deinococcales bacterium]
MLAAALGLLLTGSFVQLARRFGWGKAIRSAGPESHQAKAGTPTMGGAAFLLAATVAWLLLGDDLGADLAPALLVLGSGLLGLWDDALALQRKRAIAQGLEVGTGLLARYRLLGQGALALGFAVWAVGAGHALFGVAWLDVLAYAFVVVGSINALNFTDGLDGLAAGVAAIALLFFLGSPFAAALLGALLGFLWYNAHPARVIMGGVGAEALGAGLAALAITQGTVWYLPLVLLVPVLEVVSVILQVSYFRATGGKRIFRMTPLHHHFELGGWPETRIVQRAYVVTALLVALALALRGAA